MAGPGCHGRGHRPCHSDALGSGPPGGQSPRPTPDPPPAGASPPLGRALAFRGAWTDRSTGHRRARAGETRCVSCSRPEGRMAGPGCHGRGHRPCQSATLGSGPAGGQSPRPAPDPPMAGAGLCWCGLHRSWWQRSARAGKRGAFPLPARTGEGTLTASMAGAIAPATALRWHQHQPGATAPGQRPTRPWRALLACRVGRWPLLVRVAQVLVAAFRAGGETRRVSCSRPEGRKQFHR